MIWKAIGLVALAVVLGLLMATGSRANDEDKLYLVDVHGRRDIELDAAKKLAPSLIATRDGGGILKGSDALGRPVISVPAKKLTVLHESKAVRAVHTDVPKDWQPVRRLKLSYGLHTKPDDAELTNLGLRLVEDYQKGRFMVVEPKNGQIDAELTIKLEHCPKIEYIAPLFRTKAIQPHRP